MTTAFHAVKSPKWEGLHRCLVAICMIDKRWFFQ